ncbi:MAG: YitT family protein [Clostridiales bacterium]|nr:YitT family protein [Clostridiales bacterium]
MDKTKVFKEVKRYAFMILGCLSYALSLKAFLEPNNIVGGGVSGAASLIHLLTGLPTGVFIAVINIPILIFGFKKMGWKFILRCFITTACLSLATEFWELILPEKEVLIDTITSDGVLASLYGGILQGIGIGLFIKYETSSGGTELLGRLTHGLLPFGTIATHVAIFDGMVVLMGALFLNSLENILYALILIFVSAKVSDMIVMGLAKAKLCYIITTKAEEISDFLISHSPRGVTLINGEGMYTRTPKGVLMTCVKSKQIVGLKASIKELDENAFVIVCDANEVYGKGFNHI